MSYENREVWYLTSYQTDFFDVLITMVTNAGWTLHDNISATEKVFKSTGETGNEVPVYVKLRFATTYLYMRMYLYWDATAHVGYCQSTTAESTIALSATAVSRFYVSKDMIFLCGGVTASAIIGILCSRIENITDPTRTITTDAITAGSGVSIPVTDSSGFRPAKNYQIVGANYSSGFEGRYSIRVDSIPDSTHLIVQTLPVNFVAGAYIGVIPCTWLRIYDNASFTAMCPIEGVGLVDATYRVELQPFLGNTSSDPDVRTNMFAVCRVQLIENTSGDSIWGICPNETAYIKADSLSSIYCINSAPAIEQGTANSATNVSLTDTDKAWTDDEWIGKMLVIVSGTGVGQVRKITDNDATTLTVSTFKTTPSSDSIYYIVDEVYRYVNFGSSFCLKETY